MFHQVTLYASSVTVFSWKEMKHIKRKRYRESGDAAARRFKPSILNLHVSMSDQSIFDFVFMRSTLASGKYNI